MNKQFWKDIKEIEDEIKLIVKQDDQLYFTTKRKDNTKLIAKYFNDLGFFTKVRQDNIEITWTPAFQEELYNKEWK